MKISARRTAAAALGTILLLGACSAGHPALPAPDPSPIRSCDGEPLAIAQGPRKQPGSAADRCTGTSSPHGPGGAGACSGGPCPPAPAPGSGRPPPHRDAWFPRRRPLGP